jgi:hypothetical protein
MTLLADFFRYIFLSFELLIRFGDLIDGCKT